MLGFIKGMHRGAGILCLRVLARAVHTSSSKVENLRSERSVYFGTCLNILFSPLFVFAATSAEANLLKLAGAQ